ncbi:MAG TPA: DUF4442 domain-containing protein [Salinimicrobium sp.]|nr:DUF4442 domain-containing protein [Salinimicrobium sp.]
MPLSPRKYNIFLLFKVPAAWICGVRILKITRESCSTGVRHRWINQNPFKSMYFAVQAMAAELSTGALVMNEINTIGKKISMLVLENNSVFKKKATGKIIFKCEDGPSIRAAIEKAIETDQPQDFWTRSAGINEKGEEVSEFNFRWTIKPKSKAS